MKKVLLFDVDETIADTGKKINSKVLEELKRLSEVHHIGLVSVRPIQYLYGLVREAELKNIFLIGENGGTMVYPAVMPPEISFITEHNYDFLFKAIEDKYKLKYKEYLYRQPSDTNLGFFISENLDFEEVANEFEKEFDYSKSDIKIYKHKESRGLAAIPNCIDKGIAIEKMLEYLGLSDNKIYAFGNGSNDIPMLEKAKKVFIVGNLKYDKKKNQTLTRVNKIKELASILSLL